MKTLTGHFHDSASICTHKISPRLFVPSTSCHLETNSHLRSLSSPEPQAHLASPSSMPLWNFQSMLSSAIMFGYIIRTFTLTSTVRKGQGSRLVYILGQLP
ncbi:hypothetical protein VFPPC_08267 [Pochonia chlamydosporia 170]|uniref:Uncharacterized protein n=1 Tax=Pochonia chlamydosporia 170 TaxID=1380566 RepID=A0A179FME4_METCM|nr:hypothetical protein VFPPC_08267 [Pochonia chlamydosporia 170]OAQ66744.1 hypothetical protein VFPPC_08267 [Pochonia chlamydosporia 170]